MKEKKLINELPHEREENRRVTSAEKGAKKPKNYLPKCCHLSMRIDKAGFVWIKYNDKIPKGY